METGILLIAGTSFSQINIGVLRVSLWLTTLDLTGVLILVSRHVRARPNTTVPVILHSRDYDRWLSREVTEQPPVDLLRPFESEDMQMSPANPLVGNVGNNGVEMLNSA